MNNVLITGSNGFIGSQLCRQLQSQNLNIRTLDRSANLLYGDSWFMDLAAEPCPTGLCTGIDTIFHLVGKAHALSETSQDEAVYRQINTEGTRKLLEAAQQAGVKRFVFFSSVKAVGDDPLQAVMDELVDKPADTPYGRSKYEAEQLVLHGGFVPHPVVIRPCMVYGNSHKGNLPKMIKAIRRGLFPPLPEFNNRRSMVHVEDVVAAALLAAENPMAAGQIYIVSDRQAYSTHQLYNLIRQALGMPPKQWTIPVNMLDSMAKIGDMIGRLSGRRFLFDSDALRKLKGSACYSSAKISSELGFHPRFTLQQTLPDIIRYLDLS
jgi:nucleoside-diphosphate-sugar epimerase